MLDHNNEVILSTNDAATLSAVLATFSPREAPTADAADELAEVLSGARVVTDDALGGDVIGLDAFLRDFDRYFCKLFDGTRHDSGDPFAWGEKVLAHYRDNRVDPRNKVLVFSDGLDIPRVMQLYAHFRGRCQLAFGVGTNLTNDVGPAPINIVIKMIRCNGQPVAKLSDSPGKNMCEDPDYVAYLRRVFSIPATQGA